MAILPLDGAQKKSITIKLIEMTAKFPLLYKVAYFLVALCRICLWVLKHDMSRVFNKKFSNGQAAA